MDFRDRLPIIRCIAALAGLSLAGLSPLGCAPAEVDPGSGTRADAGTDGSGAGAGTGGTLGTGGAPAGGTGGTGGTGSPVGTGGATQSGGAPGAPGSGGLAGGRTGGQTGAAGRVGTGGQPALGGRGGTAGPGGPATGGTTGPGSGGSGTGGMGGAGGNVTIWLAGDSTVANGSAPCPIGWGAQFRQNFDSRITVTNSAAGGTSLHTWLYFVLDTEDAAGECNLMRDAAGAPVLQPRWQAMLNGMKAGDYLFIQFGINDGGSGTLSPHGCPRYEGAATFKTSLGMMAQAAKDRGAHPIFVTPVSSISCAGAVARGTRGRFVTDTIAAGTQYDVPVLDLHALSVAHYTASGFCPLPGGATDVSATTGGDVGAFFCDDHTHFSATGAVDIGGLVIDGIRSLNLPLASYLN